MSARSEYINANCDPSDNEVGDGMDQPEYFHDELRTWASSQGLTIGETATRLNQPVQRVREWIVCRDDPTDEERMAVVERIRQNNPVCNQAGRMTSE